MLEHFRSKIETAVREEALKDFTEDFHALGDLIKEAFEEVGARLGYSIGEEAAPNEIYEAIRKPLASVRLMIEKGVKPPVEEIVSDDPAYVETRRLNTFIRDFAEAYLKSGEDTVWNRMYEKATEWQATEQSHSCPTCGNEIPA